MPDLFFYRDPEDVEKEEAAREEAVAASKQVTLVPPASLLTTALISSLLATSLLTSFLTSSPGGLRRATLQGGLGRGGAGGRPRPHRLGCRRHCAGRRPSCCCSGGCTCRCRAGVPGGLVPTRPGVECVYLSPR